MMRERWVRYRRLVDESQWEIESGIVHETDGGRTLCGVRVGKTTDQGGPWERTSYPVDCKRCLRARGS